MVRTLVAAAWGTFGAPGRYVVGVALLLFRRLRILFYLLPFDGLVEFCQPGEGLNQSLNTFFYPGIIYQVSSCVAEGVLFVPLLF